MNKERHYVLFISLRVTPVSLHNDTKWDTMGYIYQNKSQKKKLFFSFPE